MAENHNVTISVIVPIYNTARYLPAFLHSLAEQEPGPYDAEYIFIDDQSIDDSVPVLRRWLQCEGRQSGISGQSRVVELPCNQGASHARNVGLDLATADFVSMPDSDDYLTRSYYRSAATLAVDLPEDCSIIDCPVFFWNGDDFNHSTAPRPDKYTRGNGIVDLYTTPTSFKSHAASALFRRKHIQDAGIRFRETVNSSEDALFCCDVLLSREIPYIAVSIDSRYYYRQRESDDGMSTQGLSHPEWIIETIEHGFLEILGQFFDDCPPQWLAESLLYYYKFLLRSLQQSRAAWSKAQIQELSLCMRKTLQFFTEDQIRAFSSSSLSHAACEALLGLRSPSRQEVITAVDPASEASK